MADTPLPRTPGPPPPVYLAVALLLEWALHRWLPITHWLEWTWRWLGLAVILAGVASAVSARMRFVKHGTAVRPFTPSSALVTDGPFRYTRNPMYWGMLLVLTGEALLFGSLGPFLVVPAFWCFLNFLFVRKEEECMRIQFGKTYEEYCMRVRRWI